MGGVSGKTKLLGDSMLHARQLWINPLTKAAAWFSCKSGTVWIAQPTYKFHVFSWLLRNVGSNAFKSRRGPAILILNKSLRGLQRTASVAFLR